MSKRTYTTYFDEKRNITVIDKPKSDMNAMERYLIKYDKEHYTNKKPEKVMTTQEKLDYRTAQMLKKEKQEQKQLWKDYDKYIKNPKKYENKTSKQEKAIMKFFKEKRKKIIKNDKNVKEAKKWKKKGLVYHLAYEEIQKEFEEILTFGESSVYTNPNKTFRKRNSQKNLPEERSILLEAIEEEILNRLNSDDLCFGMDNITVQYKNSTKKSKKAKKKASELLKSMTI